MTYMLPEKVHKEYLYVCIPEDKLQRETFRLIFDSTMAMLVPFGLGIELIDGWFFFFKYTSKGREDIIDLYLDHIHDNFNRYITLHPID